MKCGLLENVNFSFCLAKEEHRPTSKSNKSIVDSSKLKISKYKGTFTFKQIKNLEKCLIILKTNKYYELITFMVGVGTLKLILSMTGSLKLRIRWNEQIYVMYVCLANSNLLNTPPASCTIHPLDIKYHSYTELIFL